MDSNSEIQEYNVYPMLHFCRKFSSSVTVSTKSSTSSSVYSSTNGRTTGMTSYPLWSFSTTTTFTPRCNNLCSYWTWDESLVWVSSQDKILLAWRRSTNSPREWSLPPRKPSPRSVKRRKTWRGTTIEEGLQPPCSNQETGYT